MCHFITFLLKSIHSGLEWLQHFWTFLGPSVMSGGTSRLNYRSPEKTGHQLLLFILINKYY